MQFDSVIKHPVVQALLTAAVALPLVTAAYFVLEPAVAVGQVSEDFTVSQEITGEISFEVAPVDVTMQPTIPGLTGGTATGSTPFTISTNNPAGYTVTIAFQDDAAMQYNDGGAEIPNLGSDVQVDFTDGVGVNEAAFGFTVTGTSTVSALLGTTSCGSGDESADNCWVLPDNTSGTPYTIVDSSEATPAAGNENTVYFQVHVNENPDPSLPLGFYTATATLTATEK